MSARVLACRRRLCKAGREAAMELDCVVQSYEWGKRGEKSEVGRLKRAATVCDDPASSFSLDETKPYAELWMGTHPSGPAKIKASGQLLGEYIAERNVEGRCVVGKVPPAYSSMKSDLPFMFKVLSINTALSIQAHPDKVLAEKLHAQYPDIYKDGNHKPEMAIALTPFEALSGFRTVEEIQKHISEYSELKTIIGVEAADKFLRFKDGHNDKALVQANLKSIFSGFMTCSDEVANEQIDLLVARLGSLSTAGSADKVVQLILRLNSDYPRDRGVLCPLLFNYLELQEGQGFFMGANEPHAYISGDCVECMALSDNVVRAGLTPKLRDVATLVDMLTYTSSCPRLLEASQQDAYTLLYRPDAGVCAEFELSVTILPGGAEPYAMSVMDCACILLLLGGRDGAVSVDGGEEVRWGQGRALFVHAGAEVTVTAKEGGAKFYRANVNQGW